MALRFFVFVGFLGCLGLSLLVLNFRDYTITQKIVLEKPQEESAVVAVKAEAKKEEVVFTPADLKGKEVFEKSGKCVTCHGPMGEGDPAQEAPRLAGQHDWYLRDQLSNFKTGVRKNAKMLPYIQNLSEQDFQDVSGYLSKLK